MSLPSNRDEIIEFLVRRKFGTVLAIPSAASHQSWSDRTTTIERARLNKDRDRYRLQLAQMHPVVLEPIYEAERAAALGDAQRDERERFFNLPHADADFDHWSKMEYWSLDEATALVMGKAPEIVSWDEIKTFKNVSPFVRQYARLRDLTERAKIAQKLFDHVLPTIFIRWADNNEIAVPTELRELIAKRKGTLGDWKKNYDELRSMYDQHVKDWKDLSKRQSVLIDAKEKLIVELKAQLDEKSAEVATPEPLKSQSPVERENMLKVIYAMAEKGYGFDPTQKRSPTVSEITSDMALAGLPLSDDTIRRYLKEASDKLDDWRDHTK